MTTFTHIAHDKYGVAIQALGTSAGDAIANAVEAAGPMFGPEGNDLTAEHAAEKFVAMPATPALIAQVEERGGAIAWGQIDGTACTAEEENATE